MKKIKGTVTSSTIGLFEGSTFTIDENSSWKVISLEGKSLPISKGLLIEIEENTNGENLSLCSITAPVELKGVKVERIFS